jgi:hypothetical protein
MCFYDDFILLQFLDMIFLSNPPIQFPTLAGMMTSELSSQVCSLGPLYESGGGGAAWGPVLENEYSFPRVVRSCVAA